MINSPIHVKPGKLENTAPTTPKSNLNCCPNSDYSVRSPLLPFDDLSEVNQTERKEQISSFNLKDNDKKEQCKLNCYENGMGEVITIEPEIVKFLKRKSEMKLNRNTINQMYLKFKREDRAEFLRKHKKPVSMMRWIYQFIESED